VYYVHNSVAQLVTFQLLRDLIVAMDTKNRPNLEAEKEFLKAIMNTSVMQLCHQMLCLNLKVFFLFDFDLFSAAVYRIWFKQNSNSGFRHIFAGRPTRDALR